MLMISTRFLPLKVKVLSVSLSFDGTEEGATVEV